MSTSRIPEGMTDPDEIDAWLEARDDVDVAAPTVLPRHNPDAATRPDTIAAIRASRDYAQLPFWRRWRTPQPHGWHPPATGPINY